MGEEASANPVGEVVELLIDPRRGEKVAVELPVSYRRPPGEARARLGLADWVDLTDPIVAKAVVLLDAVREADPPIHLAILGGVASRMRSRSSNDRALGLRRPLHDLDLACLHREVKAVRRFLTTAHEREGSGLQFFETAGDRIFNSLAEGRRFRYHMVIGQRGNEVDLGAVDLLADEFRFCHRFDLRPEVQNAAAQHGTLSPALLLLAKLQFIQRIPGEDRAKVPHRVLEAFGRHDVVIGPEDKDVKDILALLADHPLTEGPDGISPARLAELFAADGGLCRTAELNLGMIGRSPILGGLPAPPGAIARSQLDAVRAICARSPAKRSRGLFGGPWWEEVDATPSVDGTVTVEEPADVSRS